MDGQRKRDGGGWPLINGEVVEGQRKREGGGRALMEGWRAKEERGRRKNQQASARGGEERKGEGREKRGGGKGGRYFAGGHTSSVRDQIGATGICTGYSAG